MSKQKHTDLSSNQIIRETIQKISRHGLFNPANNTLRGTERIAGWVAKIHTEGDLAGTIDVQEFATSSINSSDDVKIGYHEGVQLSAIQDNSKGLLIVPKLHSEVVIVRDPVTYTEYVSMFSHVDVIQLDSHDTIIVGVREREEFDDGSEDSPDIQDLEETGVFSKTTYLKDSITTEVQGEDESNHTKHLMDSEKVETVVGDDKSSMMMDQEKIHLKHNKAETILDEEQHTSKFGGSMVKIEDGTVFLGSDSSTDDAVLGVELATILSELVGYLGQIMTPTMMGPQPPVNMASFISLKAKIDAFKSSHSGFLTKKVQVQK